MSSYNDKRHVSLAITSIQEDYGTNNTATKRQEEATQIKNHDAQYWNVKLPSNELDDLMWGVGVGIPPPAAMEPRFQRSWAKKKKNDVVVSWLYYSYYFYYLFDEYSYYYYYHCYE